MAERAPGEPGGWVQLSVELRDSGQLVGDVGLSPDEHDPAIIKVGYTMDPVFQGRGYATEAVRALIDYAFDALGAETVRAFASAENLASIRVAEKVGLRLEERFERTYDGETWQGVRYELARSDRFGDAVTRAHLGRVSVAIGAFGRSPQGLLGSRELGSRPPRPRVAAVGVLALDHLETSAHALELVGEPLRGWRALAARRAAASRSRRSPRDRARELGARQCAAHGRFAVARAVRRRRGLASSSPRAPPFEGREAEHVAEPGARGRWSLEGSRGQRSRRHRGRPSTSRGLARSRRCACRQPARRRRAPRSRRAARSATAPPRAAPAACSRSAAPRFDESAPCWAARTSAPASSSACTPSGRARRADPAPTPRRSACAAPSRSLASSTRSRARGALATSRSRAATNRSGVSRNSATASSGSGSPCGLMTGCLHAPLGLTRRARRTDRSRSIVRCEPADGRRRSTSMRSVCVPSARPSMRCDHAEGASAPSTDRRRARRSPSIDTRARPRFGPVTVIQSMPTPSNRISPTVPGSSAMANDPPEARRRPFDPPGAGRAGA